MKNRRFELLKEKFSEDFFAKIAMGILITLILLAVFAFLSPHDPDLTNVQLMKNPPSSAHWFGTDEVGRDYLTRSLYGARVSLAVGILSMLTSTIIGTIVGTVSGYFGGFVDSLLMRLVDVLSSIPWMILVTIVSIFIQGGIFAIVFVIGGFTWMRAARIVRAETLSLNQREYVLYAKASGQSHFNIMKKHILPGLLPTVVVTATIFIPQAIIIESTLSFLGLGVKAPMSSWGSMLKSALNSLDDAPYLALIPGIMILLTVYSFNKLGDLLRVVVDPKSSGGN